MLNRLIKARSGIIIERKGNTSFYYYQDKLFGIPIGKKVLGCRFDRLEDGSLRYQQFSPDGEHIVTDGRYNVVGNIYTEVGTWTHYCPGITQYGSVDYLLRKKVAYDENGKKFFEIEFDGILPRISYTFSKDKNVTCRFKNGLLVSKFVKYKSSDLLSEKFIFNPGMPDFAQRIVRKKQKGRNLQSIYLYDEIGRDVIFETHQTIIPNMYFSCEKDKKGKVTYGYFERREGKKDDYLIRSDNKKEVLNLYLSHLMFWKIEDRRRQKKILQLRDCKTLSAKKALLRASQSNSRV